MKETHFAPCGHPKKTLEGAKTNNVSYINPIKYMDLRNKKEFQ